MKLLTKFYYVIVYRTTKEEYLVFFLIRNVNFSMYDRWVMEQKELKKIKRRELLELMLEQAKRIQELELEIKDLKSELNSKKIKIKESGSIAEASLKLNNVFEDAQNAVNQYFENFKDNCKRIESSIKKEATLEKNRIINETIEKCKKRELEFENKLKKREEDNLKISSKTKKVVKKTSSSKNKSSRNKRKR